MTAKNYFTTGFTELLILSILKRGDSYVYDIIRTIEDYSGGRLTLSPNTVYTSAYKLEREGMMTEYSKLVGKKRTRIYYKITVQGIVYLDELMAQYKLAFDGITLFFEKMKEDSAVNAGSNGNGINGTIGMYALINS